MAMGDRKRGSVPADMARVRERFAAWRRKKPPRSRIPHALWKLAIRLVDRHGLHRTASALKLDYYSLKKQVELARGNGNAPAAFVEVAAAPLLASGECVIELEDGAGASMRVTLKGHSGPDLAALVGSFWKAD
jgi:hypothetical protein